MGAATHRHCCQCRWKTSLSLPLAINIGISFCDEIRTDDKRGRVGRGEHNIKSHFICTTTNFFRTFTTYLITYFCFILRFSACSLLWFLNSRMAYPNVDCIWPNSILSTFFWDTSFPRIDFYLSIVLSIGSRLAFNEACLQIVSRHKSICNILHTVYTQNEWAVTHRFPHPKTLTVRLLLSLLKSQKWTQT